LRDGVEGVNGGPKTNCDSVEGSRQGWLTIANHEKNAGANGVLRSRKGFRKKVHGRVLEKKSQQFSQKKSSK